MQIDGYWNVTCPIRIITVFLNSSYINRQALKGPSNRLVILQIKQTSSNNDIRVHISIVFPLVLIIDIIKGLYLDPKILILVLLYGSIEWGVVSAAVLLLQIQPSLKFSVLKCFVLIKLFFWKRGWNKRLLPFCDSPYLNLNFKLLFLKMDIYKFLLF